MSSTVRLIFTPASKVTARCRSFSVTMVLTRSVAVMLSVGFITLPVKSIDDPLSKLNVRRGITGNS